MDKIAISKTVALKMFWDAGFDTEYRLLRANLILADVTQASPGYYYAEDVLRKIRDKNIYAAKEMLGVTGCGHTVYANSDGTLSI